MHKLYSNCCAKDFQGTNKHSFRGKKHSGQLVMICRYECFIDGSYNTVIIGFSTTLLPPGRWVQAIQSHQ